VSTATRRCLNITGAPFATRARAPRRAGRASRAGHRPEGGALRTCFVNYNNPSIGEATQAWLAKNGVETETLYPQCCQMPQLEAGDLAKVAAAAKHVASTLGPIDRQWL
jgi:glycerol-3-phosphate dehydrogenase subunit C